MMILDAKSLLSSIDKTTLGINSLYNQISAIQRAVRDFSALDDVLKGSGGTAIRSFYSDGHQPFLIFLFQSLVDYKNVLSDIQSAIESYESHANGFVRQDFLESDITNGLENVKKRTIELTADANSILQRVQDLVAVSKIDESEVVDTVRRGNEKVRNMIEELKILDSYGVSRLEKTKDNLQTMKSYISELDAKFTSGGALTDFNAKAMQGLTSYSTIMDGIYNKESSESTTLDGKTIETMPIYEIGKAKDAELEGISEDAKEIVNLAFKDLENGVIDRQEFLRILLGMTSLERDIAEGKVETEVEVTLLEYVEKNQKTIAMNGYAELIGKLINDLGKEVVGTGQSLKKFPVSLQWAHKAGDAVIKHGKNIAGAGTVLGGVAMVGGFSIGMYDDIANNGKTVGEAIAHNGAAAGVGLATNTIITASIVGLASNPVGWAVIGGVATGLFVTSLFNVAYENNWLGIQDGLDWIGGKIDSTWETTKEIATNVGEAIKDGLNAINPLKWGWW
ncbi:ribonuclease YeeF family protein [Paucisalibacillus globulus]|uniref:ribonuclease YeeF family protein n=1 Tax=Paucisalibacillus globulus TaxID=351095 RepID=UPI0004221F10|nr:T7SS effector LXG polymorphic toxin [Paucisalibacillus globulus]